MFIVIMFILQNIVFSRDCPTKNSQIKSLPYFSKQDLPCMYSEFLTVDTYTKSNIFYWLILNKDYSKKPLIISLNGDVGKSGLFSLFTVNGPLRLSGIDKTNIYEDYSWSALANILYVDFPVGTGYSFTNYISGIPTNEEELCKQFFVFLQRFYSSYQSIINNNIYLVGDSFSGKYIPALTKYILEKNELIRKQEFLGNVLNIRKIGLGNTLLDTSYQLPARKHLALGIGLMSEFDDENQFDFLVQKCDSAAIKKNEKSLVHCKRVLEYLQDLGGDIFEFDVRRTMDKDDKLIKILSDYLNQESVLEALNIKGQSTKMPYWTLKNSTVVDSLKNHYTSYSSVDSLAYLLNMTFPIFLYAGQFDLSLGPNGLISILNTVD